MPVVAQAAAWVVAAVKGAVVATGAKIGFSAATSVAIAKTAASIALSAALSAAAVPASYERGTQLSFKADPQAGIPQVLGRTATGGNIVFKYPSGPNWKHDNHMVVLSGGPIQGIDQFKMNGQVITWNNATGKPTNNSTYKDRVWLKVALGGLNQAALTQPTQPATDSPLPQWTSAHRLRGLAHCWLDTEWDQDIWTSQITPIWVVKGRLCYDPRRDDTFPGGSGPHRLNDPTTREWSENAGVLAYNWALGWWADTTRVAGVGMPQARIDSAAFVEMMNVNDANGWKAGGVVTTTDSKWTVLKAICQAGGAEVFPSGALLSVRVYAPKVSLATITVNDLAGDGDIPSTKPQSERKNAITPRYRSESHNWEIVDAAEVSVPAYIAEDKRKRAAGVDFPLVQDARQAAQLATYMIVNGREFGPMALPLKPGWLGFKGGDCLTVHFPERGLNNQQCVVTGRGRDHQTGVVTLTFESETPAKHPFALGQTATPPPTPGLTTPDFAQVPAPLAGQWVAEGTSLAGPTASVPCITVTGSATDNVFATEVIIDYRKVGDTDWTMWPSSPATQTKITIAGLGGSLDYEVGVRYKTVQGVTSQARLVLGPVTTPAGSGVASSIVNQGDLATRDDVVFGTPTIRETEGGTNASLSNFKTLLGIAAGFANQGAWATLLTNPDVVFSIAPNLVYDGGLRLGGDRWTKAFVHTGGNGEGPMMFSGSGGDQFNLSDFFDVYASTPYTLQLDMYAGGVTAGVFAADLIWYDAANNVIGYSAPATATNGQVWASKSVTGTSPSTATRARVQVYLVGATNTNAAFRRVKVANASLATIFSDEATFGARYGTGQIIDLLKPQELGANITEIRVAAAIAGQGTGATTNVGALAVLNSLALGSSYLTGFGAVAGQGEIFFGSTYLTESNGGSTATLSAFKTILGVASAISNQTAWATYTGAIGSFASRSGIDLSEVGDRWAGYVTYTGGATVNSLKPGEAGANVTESRVAAAIAGQGTGATTNVGALAVFNQIALNSTYLKMADGTTMVTESIVVTSIGVAAGFINQAALATQNAIAVGQVYDPAQPSIPLRAVAMASFRTNLEDVTASYGSGYAYGDTTAEYAIDGSSSKFVNNGDTATVDPSFRIRTGKVPFELIGSATVEHTLTLWYRRNSGAWQFLTQSIEPLGGSGTVPVFWNGYIDIAAGDSITFAITPRQYDGNWYSGSNPRRLLNCVLTAKAINI